MSDETVLTKAELLAKIAAGWDDLQSYLAGLDFEQVVAPSDPAGWTPKDHLVHLAIWEDSINALLDGKPRWEHMGVPQDLFERGEWDDVNAIIQQRYHDLPLGDVQQLFFDIHGRLVAKLEALSEADLARPYRDYQPGSTDDTPIRYWFSTDTYAHYDEHKGYIQIIIQNNPDAVAEQRSTAGGDGTRLERPQHVSEPVQRRAVDRPDRRGGLVSQGSSGAPRALGGWHLGAAEPVSRATRRWASPTKCGRATT